MDHVQRNAERSRGMQGAGGHDVTAMNDSFGTAFAGIFHGGGEVFAVIVAVRKNGDFHGRYNFSG